MILKLRKINFSPSNSPVPIVISRCRRLPPDRSPLTPPTAPAQTAKGLAQRESCICGAALVLLVQFSTTACGCATVPVGMDNSSRLHFSFASAGPCPYLGSCRCPGRHTSPFPVRRNRPSPGTSRRRRVRRTNRRSCPGIRSMPPDYRRTWPFSPGFGSANPQLPPGQPRPGQ